MPWGSDCSGSTVDIARLSRLGHRLGGSLAGRSLMPRGIASRYELRVDRRQQDCTRTFPLQRFGDVVIVHIAKSAMTWTVESLCSDLKRQTVSTDSQWGYVVTRSSRDDRSIYLCSYYLILSTRTSGLAFLGRIRWSVK